MKTIIVTQAFCKAEMLVNGFNNLYQYGSKTWDEHWVLLKHYPLDKENNHRRIREIAEGYKCKVFDCQGDIGLHEGLNYFFKHNPQPRGTRMIGWDPDSMVLPCVTKFDTAMNNVMTAMNVPIVALWNAGIASHKQSPEFYSRIENHKVYIHPAVDMWNVALYDMDWVEQIGGFKEPYAYYGGLESYLHSKMNGKKLVYLPEFMEDYPTLVSHDPRYIEYKSAHIGGFKGSFEEWLNK